MRSALLLVVVGCGNSLPPPGSCEVAGGGDAVVEHVALGGLAGFDDLAFSRGLGKIVAAPEGSGHVYLVEPDSKEVAAYVVPSGVTSADASATTIYVSDRGSNSIVAFDIATMARGAAQTVSGAPDYMRVSPTTGEIWVTVPGRDRIEILEPSGLAPIASVDLPGSPEGLTFDGNGRAYTNNEGSVVAIDVARRVVVGEWDDGCGLSHGFPQIDVAYGLAIGGCHDNGGAGVTTTDGDLRAGYEAGGGAAVLAYDDAKHHLFLRGDPSDTLSILAVCSNGQLGELARVPIPSSGHASAYDGRGHVWVADATTGGLVRITDPFAGTN